MTRAAVFCTTDVSLALRMLARVRQRWPACEWSVYAGARYHAAICAACPDVVLVDDKPPGSKLAFVRALRQARYQLAVVAWHGHPHLDRMKLVALMSGAHRLVGCDENMEIIVLERGCAGACIRHLRRRRRLGTLSAMRLLVPVAWGYRATLGWVVGLARSWSAARHWSSLLRR